MDEREFYKNLDKKSDEELRIYLNELCQKIYAAEYFEIFDFEPLTRDDMIQKCIYLKNKLDIIDHDGNKGSKERNFLDIWRDWWDIRIGHQSDIRDMYAFVGLSQIMRHVQIPRSVDDDLRIHFAVIAPPATGKSEANDLLADFCDLVDLKMHFVGHSWLNAPRANIFKSKNIVCFDEGKAVLKAGNNVIMMLLATMNRHNSRGNSIIVEKQGEEITINPAASILITTYPPDDIKKHFRNGLLQRIITYFQMEDPLRRSAITDHIINSIPTFKDDINEAREENLQRSKTIEILKNEIKTEVEKLRDYHEKTDYVFMREGANDVVDNYINELRNIMPNMDTSQQMLWNEMMSRLTINLIKLSALYALMNYRNYITNDDVHNAACIMFPVARSVAIFITRGMKMDVSDKKYKHLYDLMKRDWLGYRFTTSGWQKIMETQYNVSQQASRDILDMMVKTGKMRVYTNKITYEKLMMLN